MFCPCCQQTHQISKNMAILVFVESAEGRIKKTSVEAVAYAFAMGGPVTAFAFGTVDKTELADLGKYGASKVLHAEDKKFDEGIVQAYTGALAQAMKDEQADILVLANSSVGQPVAARLAAKVEASLATNVVSLPDTTSGFVVRKSIYTGKAFCLQEMTQAKKIIAIRKNAAEAREVGSAAEVVSYAAVYPADDLG